MVFFKKQVHHSIIIAIGTVCITYRRDIGGRRCGGISPACETDLMIVVFDNLYNVYIIIMYHVWTTSITKLITVQSLEGYQEEGLLVITSQVLYN
jgi:hypothetical protein